MKPLGFPPVDTSNVALVVIDMQHDFVDEGAPCAIGNARSVVPAIARAITAFRAAGRPIIFVRTVWQRDGIDRSKFVTSEEIKTRGLLAGDPGTEIIPELAPQDGDYIVNKTRYSGFFQTNLDSLTRALGLQYIVAVGVASSICVRATVADAAYRDIFSFVPVECTTTDSAEEQQATLSDIDKCFGMTLPLDELLDALDGSTSLV